MKTSTRIVQDGLLEVLQVRQQKILAQFPKFAVVTAIAAMVGFVSIIAVQLGSGTFPEEERQSFLLSQLSLGAIIAWLLSLFSNLVMWIFVLWSLTFIPFTAYHAFRSSQGHKPDVVTKPFRWIQLSASTFLPMTIFSIAWNSAATSRGSNIVIQVRTAEEWLTVIAGAIAVSGSLFLINKSVPVRWVSVRLSFISSLLYASLFLAYGWGFGLVSHSMLFGILSYLMFGSSQVEEVGRRIAIYDIDPKIAEKLDEIAMGHQQLRSTQDETLLKEKEYEARSSRRHLELKIAQTESDEKIETQLSDIRTKKIELNQQMNVAQIQIFEQKINMLGGMFDAVSKELRDRLHRDIPEQVKLFKESTKDRSPKELYEQMNVLIRQMNESLDGIPESLGQLRTMLIETTTELEKQTRALSSNESKGQDDQSA